MEAQIPAASTVRERLSRLSHAGVRKMAIATGVPFTTLWKMRSGETADPRLETVRKIWPELSGSEGAQQGAEVRDAA